MDNTTYSLPRQGPKEVIEGKKAVCSSSHPLVTETMRDVLSDGGNAVDAAVVGSLLQATIGTHLTNHGGASSACTGMPAQARRTS